MSILKQARVQHTFGNEEASGWVPPHAPQPPRAQRRIVDLLVQIERTDGGFILRWIGPSREYCGDHWYIELPYAENGAEELFGITDDQWEDAS